MGQNHFWGLMGVGGSFCRQYFGYDFWIKRLNYNNILHSFWRILIQNLKMFDYSLRQINRSPLSPPTKLIPIKNKYKFFSFHFAIPLKVGNSALIAPICEVTQRWGLTLVGTRPRGSPGYLPRSPRIRGDLGTFLLNFSALQIN